MMTRSSLAALPLLVFFAIVRSAFGADQPAAPALRVEPLFRVTADRGFKLQLKAAGNPPISYEAAALPPGLKLDSTTGVIEGKIPPVGVYRFTVTATNAAGKTSASLRILSQPASGFYEYEETNPFALQNSFINQLPAPVPIPSYAESKPLLPEPIWQGHEATLACYWKAWEIAFKNLKRPSPQSPFVSSLIDTAFNGSTFMWDSSFMMMFGLYGERAFHFQGTLDNFYAMQHRDGFICREIRISDGKENFRPAQISSTGPNVMPWAEWEYYQKTGDRERLARVFPVLLAYTQWFQKNRAWPDGSYFSSGWGCGMDNQPRLPKGFNQQQDHGFMSWVDTTLQAVFANKILIKMAAALGRERDVTGLKKEAEDLTAYVNTKMWDDSRAFYFDRFRDGSLSDVKSIASYWALLAGVVPEANLPKFLEHLRNPAEFNRPHRVPTLSADTPGYNAVDGGYWCGAVWAPTDYMTLRGLTAVGADSLAHEIALNHVQNVVKVYQQTGTLWENYAPETAAHGSARPDFVGWTGLSPISILFEYVFGLRPDVPHHELLWDVRLLEQHGVLRYPFGRTGLLDLSCAARSSEKETPIITASTNEALTLRIKWAGGEKTLELRPKNMPALKADYPLPVPDTGAASLYAPVSSLTIGKTATASSSEADCTPDKAVDGDMGTRWSSVQGIDPQWLAVDLGQPMRFDHATVSWETACAKSWQLQTNNDGKNWTKVYQTDDGKGGEEKISFPPVTARWVRIYGTQGGTGFGYYLYEFGLYEAKK